MRVIIEENNNLMMSVYSHYMPKKSRVSWGGQTFLLLEGDSS